MFSFSVPSLLKLFDLLIFLSLSPSAEISISMHPYPFKSLSRIHTSTLISPFILHYSSSFVNVLTYVCFTSKSNPEIFVFVESSSFSTHSFNLSLVFLCTCYNLSLLFISISPSFFICLKGSVNNNA